MPRTATAEAPPAISPHLLDLRELLRDEPAPLADFAVRELTIRLHRTATSVFVIVRREGSAGGLAVGAAFVPTAFACALLSPEKGEVARLRLTSAMGEHIIICLADRLAVERLRIATRFTPARPMVMPPAPRDLYPFGAGDDPLRVQGVVEASQRGLNTGLLYFRIDAPGFGNALYIQNFTASNDYFRATGTVPRDAVAGSWPELGYMLPIPEADADPAEVALPAGESVTLSDTILVFRHHAPPHERESARQFVQMLGSAYDLLGPPPVAYRDWVDRAERTARDLDEAPTLRSATTAIAMSTPIRAPNIPTLWCRCRSSPRSIAGAIGVASRIPLKRRSRRGCRASSTRTSVRSAVICPMSARIRMPMRSTAGISITRC